jgi:hypothetical protein
MIYYSFYSPLQLMCTGLHYIRSKSACQDKLIILENIIVNVKKQTNRETTLSVQRVTRFANMYMIFHKVTYVYMHRNHVTCFQERTEIRSMYLSYFAVLDRPYVDILILHVLSPSPVRHCVCMYNEIKFNVNLVSFDMQVRLFYENIIKILHVTLQNNVIFLFRYTECLFFFVSCDAKFTRGLS